MKAAILGLALAAAVLVAVLLLRGGAETDGRSPVPPSKPNGAPSGKLPSEAVLSVAPGTSAKAAPHAAPAMTPLMQEFSRRREYKSLYDSIRAADQRTPEQSYVLAQILDSCAYVSDRRPPRKSGWKLGGEEARQRFIASLAPKDPKRDARIAAFDRINVDPCAGLEDIETTEQEVRDLLTQAASQDAKAKAALLLRDLEPSREGMNPTISEAQLATIREVLASGDPRALVDIVAVFGLHLRDFSVRTGEDEATLEYWAMHGAATLAACELGYPCGPDSRFLLEACALQGQCDAANYRDYWFYYYSAPSTSQRSIQYHDALMRGIRQGDWSFFTFHRTPPPGTAPFQRR